MDRDHAGRTGMKIDADNLPFLPEAVRSLNPNCRFHSLQLGQQRRARPQ